MNVRYDEDFLVYLTTHKKKAFPAQNHHRSQPGKDGAERMQYDNVDLYNTSPIRPRDCVRERVGETVTVRKREDRDGESV